jgi:anthranilate synthase/indole-3-glycerol phosphate synthase/phosphoribosylanthranilate isomerase
MEPLVEVNNEQEMKIALDLGAKVIGVNNRNLHTFTVDMSTTTRLAEMCKGKDVVLCGLSGISSPEEVKQYASQGVGAVLVGEALMKHPSPTALIHHLLDIPPLARPAALPSKPLVKICGIRSPEIALTAAEAGADLIGLVFAPHSRRRVTIPTALEITNMLRTYRQKEVSDESTAPKEAKDDYNVPVQWFTSQALGLHKRISETRPLTVGVFQGQSLEEIVHIVSAAQLDLVQLHGDEPTHWAQHIPVPVIRAFHIPIGIANPVIPSGLTRPGFHQHLLLDSVKPGNVLSGGAGLPFEWDVAKSIVDQGEVKIPLGRSTGRLPVILAGGLDPSNVKTAVERVRPFAVDVSGGVETDGEKDAAKIKEFIQQVHDVPAQ